MSQETHALKLPALHVEMLGREKGYRKWRLTRGSTVFYVVICQPWGDDVFRWFISPNGVGWAETCRKDLRAYIDMAL